MRSLTPIDRIRLIQRNQKPLGIASKGSYRSWDILIERLENKYKTFETITRVDEIRKKISDCIVFMPHSDLKDCSP